MRRLFWRGLFCSLLWAVADHSADAATARPGYHLKILTQSAYLPDIPVLVRVEVVNVAGERDLMLWDAEATLSSASPGVALSTNRVVLHNGLGSALVRFSGGGDFNLIATLGSLQTDHFLRALTGAPVTAVGGLLEDESTTWRGVILVTNDVLVQIGQTLTIESNTLVLINGVTNGISANDISISGAILSLGTEDAPVTITCANPDLQYRWGQIRHTYAEPSLYRFTTITRGGRAAAEGQTGTAPVIRPFNSKITFESCNIADHAQMSRSAPDFGKPGKIMQATFGSDITFNNCLLARARMGPEVSETALLVTNSWILEMYGVNDSDGLFLYGQGPGQTIKVSGSVIADGDDDGIDTLAATFTVDHSIIRNWRNPFEDSKGISIEAGEARIWRSLLVDNALGISGKGSNAATVRLNIDHCTILSESYAVGATNKTGTTPVIDYRITNSILRGTSDSIFTQYNPTDIHIDYCNIGEIWFGSGNTFSDPLFVNGADHDYRLATNSPCVDAGAPSAPLDGDGSRTDVGYFTFVPPAPLLGSPHILADGTLQFAVNAFPRRNYVVEMSTNLPVWSALSTIYQASNPNQFHDSTSTNSRTRVYRVRLAP